MILSFVSAHTLCCSAQFVKNFVALEDLSETQRELVDSCFYSHGVSLNYHQMWVMSRQLFDDNYILCAPFVHRFDSNNVNGQHMVSFVFGYCLFICSLL